MPKAWGGGQKKLLKLFSGNEQRKPILMKKPCQYIPTLILQKVSSLAIKVELSKTHKFMANHKNYQIAKRIIRA